MVARGIRFRYTVGFLAYGRNAVRSEIELLFTAAIVPHNDLQALRAGTFCLVFLPGETFIGVAFAMALRTIRAPLRNP